MSIKTLTEQQIIQGLLAKDESTFRFLVEHQKNRIYNSCLGIVQNVAVAEDITQEVFIEVFQSISSFKGKSKLSTWIYRITITKSLEFLRKQKRKKRFGSIIRLFQQEVDKPEVDVPDFVHPGVLLENKERAALLFKAIDSLSENQRIAFTLSKIDDLSYEEIAGIMGISLGSVESLLHRAKINLQKKLKSLL